MNQDELNQLIDKVAETDSDKIKLEISVYLEMGGDGPPPPVDSDYYRAVLIADKPSNRTKLWLTPSNSLPSDFYVWNGNVVEKLGGRINGFTQVRVITGGNPGQEGWTMDAEMSYEKV